MPILSDQYVKISVGTTAERPASPEAGMMRFNTSINSYEGYDGTAWASVGGGATGGGGNKVFYENDTTVTANYSIAAGKNAGTFGPVTVNNGVVVTVPDGSVWTVI